VSLQGTFDVFSLPELLRMLAASSKTGALVMEAGGIAGRIDLRDGACCAAETVEFRGPVESLDDLHHRLVEVCFAIVRESTGAFRFVAGEPPSFDAHGTIPIEPMLAEVDLLVAEWAELTKVIPSLELRPAMAQKIGTDSITLSASEWAVLSRLDGYTPVRDLVDNRQGLVEVCRAVAELVNRGAVTLLDTADESRRQGVVHEAAAAETAPTPKVVPVAPYGPGVEEAESAAGAEAQADGGSDGDGDVKHPVRPGAERGERSGRANARRSAASPAEVAREAAAAAEATNAEGSADTLTESEAAAMSDAAALADDDGEMRDRGAILRLFSALREA
jgi:hypothetical protein